MNLQTVFSKMVLSASGWRMPFSDKDKGILTYEEQLLCFAVSKAFSENFSLNKGDKILLARDSRPTGGEICNIVYETLTSSGFEVFYPGICSAPEIMAQSICPKFNAFFYVTASHNPVEYNGFKFGKNGGVFSQKEIMPAIQTIKQLTENEQLLKTEFEKITIKSVTPCGKTKQDCLKNYTDFMLKTLGIGKKYPQIGLCIDFNGSARCTSIDKQFFENLGFKTCYINDTVGQIVHGIIPEGENLQACKELLEKKHEQDSSFVLGYMPDNDGDRGNIVYINSDGKAEIINAQQVFALCVQSILKRTCKQKEERVAVAVNGPTSMRINEIADRYGAKVFRAEVGEANVVERAQKLRDEGYKVPVLGEGSNGGNITYPGKVRDPLATVICLADEIVQSNSPDRALSELPQYVTTNVTDKDAVLYLKTKNYKELKKEYEKIFVREFEKNKVELASYGIQSFLEFQTSGCTETQGKAETDNGGMKICFYSQDKKPLAFIWMRPSGTEPLFRVLADVKVTNGNFTQALKLHDKLLKWHREIILMSQEQIQGS